VRLSPLGTSATNCPIVPAPDDRWVWNILWNGNWQGKSKYSEKTCPSATLSTTNPTWPDLGLNPGRRGGKPATNRLSYGTASPASLSAPYTQRFAGRPRDRQVTRKATLEWGTHPWEPHTRRGLAADLDRTGISYPLPAKKTSSSGDRVTGRE
jgi:hypothetical protein